MLRKYIIFDRDKPCCYKHISFPTKRLFTYLLLFSPIHTPVPVEINSSSWKNLKSQIFTYAQKLIQNFTINTVVSATIPFLLSQSSPSSTSLRPFTFSIGTTCQMSAEAMQENIRSQCLSKRRCIIVLL